MLQKLEHSPDERLWILLKSGSSPPPPPGFSLRVVALATRDNGMNKSQGAEGLLASTSPTEERPACPA